MSMMIKTYLDNFGHNRLTAYRDNRDNSVISGQSVVTKIIKICLDHHTHL